MSVEILPFAAQDVVALALQPSQHVTLGIHQAVHSIDDGRELEALGPAWTAFEAAPSSPTAGGGADRGRVLACYGFGFQWRPAGSSGGHALAWAMLAAGLGPAHVAITRFARATLMASPITRIEAIVRAGVEAERRWAELVGFTRVALLRAWGPLAEDHLLYERVREGCGGMAAHLLVNASNGSPRLEALGAV